MTSNVVHGVLLGLIASPTCPSNAELVRQQTTRGLRNGLLVGIGAVAGDALVLVLLLLGLQPVLDRVRGLETALWAAGALVLAYIAWGVLHEARSAGFAGPDAPGDGASRGVSAGRAFWLGFAVTTFNPFTIVWWVGLLGPSLTDGGTGLPLAFSTSVLAGAWVWFAALAASLHLGRGLLSVRARRWILGVSGVGAAAYAAYFAWQAGASLLAVGPT